jgi:hypothetical protein
MPGFLLDLTSQSVASFAKLAKTSDASEVDLFLRRRGLEVPLSEDMITAAAGNKENAIAVVSLLLQKRRNEFKVTTNVITAAAGNEKDGLKITKLLYRGHESEWGITEQVVKAAAANENKGLEIMKFLHQKHGHTFTVTKGVIQAARGNTTSTMDIINFLLQVFEARIRLIVIEELNKGITSTTVEDVVGWDIESGKARVYLSNIVHKASKERIRVAVEMLLMLNLDADVDGEDGMNEPDRARTMLCGAIVRSLREPSASSIKPWLSWTRGIAHYLCLFPRRSGI